MLILSNGLVMLILRTNFLYIVFFLGLWGKLWARLGLILGLGPGLHVEDRIKTYQLGIDKSQGVPRVVILDGRWPFSGELSGN